MTVTGWLVVGVSVLSSLQFALRPDPNSWAIMLMDGVQAGLGIAVVMSMRTRLRRYPAAIAFGFLLLLPVVPLATLRLQQQTDALVAASLALIPIGVALFIAWSFRIYAAWIGGYLALVATLSVSWQLHSLPSAENWQFLAAVGIGAAFGLVGQRRRDHQDRIAFERERMLRSLFQQSRDQQIALERLNAELDTILAREVQGRQSIEAALAQIDASASPETIAASACAEIVKLPMAESAWAIALGAADGRVLAQAGQQLLLETGATLLPELAVSLLERAGQGPWVDTPRSVAGEESVGLAREATGLSGSVWSPIRGSTGVIGVIGCGTRIVAHTEQIAELLPAITTYGSMVGALVAPGLEARVTASLARDRMLQVLSAAAFRPFFQPIVDLRSGTVLGHEALTRFSDGTPPDAMFELAAQAGLGIELELATLRAAATASAVLPAGTYLGINASPELICSTDLRPLIESIGRQVVLEITEHVQIDDYAGLRAAIAALGPDVRLAVDDAGAGYASLRHILELAPDIVKLDVGLVRGIDSDPARQALIAGVGYFAVKRKMRLVAEGIETAAELATLTSLGLSYGQGYLLGRPRDSREGTWLDRVDVTSFG